MMWQLVWHNMRAVALNATLQLLVIYRFFFLAFKMIAFVSTSFWAKWACAYVNSGGMRTWDVSSMVEFLHILVYNRDRDQQIIEHWTKFPTIVMILQYDFIPVFVVHLVQHFERLNERFLKPKLCFATKTSHTVFTNTCLKLKLQFPTIYTNALLRWYTLPSSPSSATS